MFCTMFGCRFFHSRQVINPTGKAATPIVVVLRFNLKGKAVVVLWIPFYAVFPIGVDKPARSQNIVVRAKKLLFWNSKTGSNQAGFFCRH